MKKFMKKVRNGVKQATITVVSDACGIAHVMISYSKDACENTEASIVQRLTGEEKTAIIIDRNKQTMNTKRTIARGINLAKERIKDLNKFSPGTAEDVIIETGDHGEA